MKGYVVSTTEDAPLRPKWCEPTTIGQHSGQTPSTLLGGIDLPCTPPNNLHNLSSPWPFATWGMNILGSLPKAPGVVKYLLVVIDYFTNWIKAKPLWEITANEVEKFTWKHLICRYDLSYATITDNNTQFKAQTYKDFLTRLGIKHLVTFVEHPQTNSQVEAIDRVILRVLRTRLNKSKGLWKKELSSILWAYHCSPQIATNENLYRLTYGTNAMILVEVRELSIRRLLFHQQQNEENMKVELETTDEVQDMARIREEAAKLRAARRYNAKVQPRAFQPGDIV